MKKTSANLFRIALAIVLAATLFSGCAKVENVLNPMIKSITDGENDDIRTADLSECAAKYLVSCGMDESQVKALNEKICR